MTSVTASTPSTRCAETPTGSREPSARTIASSCSAAPAVESSRSARTRAASPSSSGDSGLPSSRCRDTPAIEAKRSFAYSTSPCADTVTAPCSIRSVSARYGRCASPTRSTWSPATTPSISPLRIARSAFSASISGSAPERSCTSSDAWPLPTDTSVNRTATRSPAASSAASSVESATRSARNVSNRAAIDSRHEFAQLHAEKLWQRPAGHRGEAAICVQQSAVLRNGDGAFLHALEQRVVTRARGLEQHEPRLGIVAAHDESVDFLIDDRPPHLLGDLESLAEQRDLAVEPSLGIGEHPGRWKAV